MVVGSIHARNHQLSSKCCVIVVHQRVGMSGDCSIVETPRIAGLAGSVIKLFQRNQRRRSCWMIEHAMVMPVDGTLAQRMPHRMLEVHGSSARVLADAPSPRVCSTAYFCGAG